MELKPLEGLNQPPQPDKDQLTKLCEQYAFSKRMFGRMVNEDAQAIQELEYDLLTTKQQLNNALKRLLKHRVLGVHAEYTKGDPLTIGLIGLGIYSPDYSCYIPINHTTDDLENSILHNANAQDVNKFLAELCTKKELELRIYNAKNFLHLLLNAEITKSDECNLIDISLLRFCINPEEKNTVSSIASDVLDVEIPDPEKLATGDNREKKIAAIKPEQLAKQVCVWAKIMYDVRVKMVEKTSNKKLRLFRRIEMAVLPVLVAMERNGVFIDENKLSDLESHLRSEIKKLEKEFAQHAGPEININSPKQLSEFLFNQLKLDTGRKTQTGTYSTNIAELERLVETSDSPVPQLILEHRQLAKLSSTYTKNLANYINKDTKRIHTSFIQTGAITGRLASKNPNLQNIPIRSEIGRQIRHCFVAQENNLLVSADYSQIELRILAHFSQDKTLLDSFANNEDVHTRTAAELYKVDISKVNSEQRRFAKTINFGLIYGMSAFGLAARLKIDRNEAQQTIDNYFERLPGVAKYLTKLRNEAKTKSFVTTLFDREIPLAGHDVSAQRAATNAPMQGTAADLMKLAMIEIQAGLVIKFPNAKLLLQIHDELVFETPATEVEELSSWVQTTMQTVSNQVNLDVPLLVEVDAGTTWGKAH